MPFQAVVDLTTSGAESDSGSEWIPTAENPKGKGRASLGQRGR